MSSRSLIRALDGYFAGSLQELDFYLLVEQFHAKHNTMNLIKTMSFDINNELSRCYNEYVAGDDALELKFIEVLGNLCRVFSIEATQKWVELYIKPAFDTGVDLRFIKQAKEFLAKLVVISPTPDPELLRLRHGVAKMVISNILKVYLAEERGVIKDQCISWIQGVVGLQPNDSDLLAVLATEFTNGKSRYGLVSLIGALDPAIVVNDPLWSTLLSSLEADLSKAVVDGVLQIITKAVPYVTTTQDWNRIMACVVKRVNWGRFVDNYSELVKQRTQWPIVPNDIAHGDSGDATAYLATMLYGLNPRDFISVARGNVQLIERELAYQLVSLPKLDWLKQMASHMLVHPQLLEETATPWAWVKDKDITLACLSLCQCFPEAQTTLAPISSEGGDDEEAMFVEHEKIFSGSSTTPATPDTSIVLADTEKSDYHLQELLLVRNQLSFVKYLKRIADMKLVETRKQQSHVCPIKPVPVPVVASPKVARNPSPKPQLTIDISEIVSRLQSLQKDHSRLEEELQDTNDKLVSVQRSYKKLVDEDIPEKNATIERLHERVEELQGAMEIPQQSQTIPVAGQAESAPVSSAWLEELDAANSEKLRCQQQQGKLETKVKALEDELEELHLSQRSKVEAVKAEVRQTLTEYLGPYERRIEELQASLRKFQALVADRDAKIARLSVSQPIQIPGQALADKATASNEDE